MAMKRRRALIATLLAAACCLLRCGGRVNTDHFEPFEPTDSGADRDAARPDAAVRDAPGDAAPDRRDAGRDSRPPIECPDVAAPPPVDWQCDPFGQTGCEAGQACRPFVQYQEGPCQYEQFGTVCAPAGDRVQGETCGTADTRCAAGFSCVKTGQGLQCVELCPIDRANTCPPGLVCEPVDVAGIGGCF
jgi:hypothetical protein